MRVAAFGLPERAGDEDVARSREALDPGGAVAEVRQLPVPAALDVRGDNFRCRSLHHGPYQALAVGRKARVAGGQLKGGNAPGAASVQGCNPDVVFGHEGDQIAVQMRETKVARRGHRSIIVKVGGPVGRFRGRAGHGEMDHANHHGRRLRPHRKRPVRPSALGWPRGHPAGAQGPGNGRRISMGSCGRAA